MIVGEAWASFSTTARPNKDNASYLPTAADKTFANKLPSFAQIPQSLVILKSNRSKWEKSEKKIPHK